MKIYVREIIEYDTDDQPLTIIKTYEHKISNPSYIIFLDK